MVRVRKRLKRPKGYRGVVEYEVEMMVVLKAVV